MNLEALPILELGLMDTNVSFLTLDFEINLCLLKATFCAHIDVKVDVLKCEIDINAHKKGYFPFNS